MSTVNLIQPWFVKQIVNAKCPDFTTHIAQYQLSNRNEQIVRAVGNCLSTLMKAKEQAGNQQKYDIESKVLQAINIVLSRDDTVFIQRILAPFPCDEVIVVNVIHTDKMADS